MKGEIQGIVFKELKTFYDERGFFREIIRNTDEFFEQGFGQWSQSLMFDGVIKAWHYHKIQTDFWYVATGVLRVGLCDMRIDSPTYKFTMDFAMGDYQKAQCLKIPPGVAHGCKVIQGPVILFYVMSHIYDPTDELRIPYNDPSIDFDWISGPKIT